MKAFRLTSTNGFFQKICILCILIALPDMAEANCPSPRFLNIDQKARYLLRDSPMVFVGKILETRLIKEAKDTSAPIFEDRYLIEDTIRGKNLGQTISIQTVSIGDGDEPPEDTEAYKTYIKERSGTEQIVLTRGYGDKGQYQVIATNGCPSAEDPGTLHGRELIDAMKREVALENDWKR